MKKTVREAVEEMRAGKGPSVVLFGCWWDWNDGSDLNIESEIVGDILKSIKRNGKVDLDATISLRDSESWFGMYLRNPNGTEYGLFNNFEIDGPSIWEVCKGKEEQLVKHVRTFDSIEKVVAYINSK